MRRRNDAVLRMTPRASASAPWTFPVASSTLAEEGSNSSVLQRAAISSSVNDGPAAGRLASPAPACAKPINFSSFAGVSGFFLRLPADDAVGFVIVWIEPSSLRSRDWPE